MLIPIDLRDWLPANHLVYFVVDAVKQLNVRAFKVNRNGSGSEQYPPDMMLTLLIYCYAVGIFSSRRIESATYTDVAVRYIFAGTAHPDHSVICTFRTENKAAFEQAFVRILALAQAMGEVKHVGGISVDGTKIKANASKHKAVSYKYAKEMMQKLEEEVKQLMKKAEDEDSTPLETGLTIPEEITIRKERLAKLELAKQEIEARYEVIEQQEQAEYEAKVKAREAKKKETGKNPRGKVPTPPSETPPDGMQFNFTDKDSRIMKAGNGQQFEQAYNAQAAVDTENSMLIVGGYVTNHANDKQELAPTVASVSPLAREVSDVAADTGYFSAQAIETIEQGTKDEQGNTHPGQIVYCAMGRQEHHRTVADIEKKAEPAKPAPDAPMKEQMAYRLQTAEGKAKYKRRKETVEPVFGIIKQVMGFRQFMVRGIEKVNTEWQLVMTAYDLKKLFLLSRRDLSIAPIGG
jgi:transposase